MEGANRLRQARLARGLTLEAISQATRLPPHIVESIDAGRFAALPAGIYARAYVRSVARLLELDADATVAELAPMLPDAPDPFPVLREAARDAVPPFGPVASRCVAAVVDGLVLFAIAATLVLLTGACTEAPIAAWDLQAAAGIVVATGLSAIPYFVLLRTLRSITDADGLRFTIGGIARRTGRVLLAESSILVDLFWAAATPARGDSAAYGGAGGAFRTLS